MNDSLTPFAPVWEPVELDLVLLVVVDVIKMFPEWCHNMTSLPKQNTAIPWSLGDSMIVTVYTY